MERTMPEKQEKTGNKFQMPKENAEKKEEKLGGNIALIGFGSLEPMEQIVVKKLVGTCVKKLMGIGNYESSKIILNSHKHSQSFLHEIKAEVVLRQGESNGKHILLNAEVTDRNLYSGLSELLGKIVREAENRLMSTKDTGEGMIRKQKKERAKSPKEEEILE